MRAARNHAYLDDSQITCLKKILEKDGRGWKFGLTLDGEKIHAQWNGFAIADWPGIWKRGKWLTRETLPFLPIVISPGRLGEGTPGYIDQSINHAIRRGDEKAWRYAVEYAQRTHANAVAKSDDAKIARLQAKEKVKRSKKVEVPSILVEMLRKTYPSPGRKAKTPHGRFKVLNKPRRGNRFNYILPSLMAVKFFGHNVAIFLEEPTEGERVTLSDWTNRRGRTKNIYITVPAFVEALNSTDYVEQAAECQRLATSILSHLKQIEAKSHA